MADTHADERSTVGQLIRMTAWVGVAIWSTTFALVAANIWVHHV